jgi:hypothetical protein
MPLQRRVPKLKGFTNPTRKEFAVVNVERLGALFEAGAEVTPRALRERGVVRRRCRSRYWGAESWATPDRPRPCGLGLCQGQDRTSRGKRPARRLPVDWSPRERGNQVLRAFVNAFKIPDLRKKILFTLFIIAVFRFGSHLPAPDIDFNKLEQEFAQSNQSVLQFIDLFSGGAHAVRRSRSASCRTSPARSSMQLLTVVIPSRAVAAPGRGRHQEDHAVDALHDGHAGALRSPTGLVFLLQQPVPGGQVRRAARRVIVLTLTAGTVASCGLGELITQRGIGNGCRS